MAVGVLYSIVDRKGAVSTMEINLPSSFSFLDVSLFATQFAPLVDAVTRGAITRIGIVFSLALPGGLKPSALDGSDVEEGAKFQFRTDQGHFSGFRVATFDEALITEGSQDVDIVDADVAALIAGIITGLNTAGGGGSGVVDPSDSRDEDIVALSFARESFQSSRG